MITTVFPLLYSSFDGDVNDLDLGDEVEYTVTRKSAKLSAENIRKVPKGTVAPEVSASIVTKSNIGFKRNVLSISNCDLGILILLVNVWFCHIYTHKAILRQWNCNGISSIFQDILYDKGVLQGKVIRPMRIVNPDQDEYSGLVQVGGDGK